MEKVMKPTDDQATAIYLSKLNASQRESGQNGHSNYMGLNFTLPAIAKNTKSKKAMNKIMVELHPDIQLCSDILTSSILASNDMMTYNLIYKVGDIKVPMDVAASLSSCIEDHIETNFKLTSRLKEITKESLIDIGAYVEVVIPEAALDEVINAKYDSEGKQLSNETYQNNLSKLNQSTGLILNNGVINISNESFGKATNNPLTDIDITDDLSVLSIPLLNKDQNAKQTNKSLTKYFGKVNNVSNEDMYNLDNMSEYFKNNDKDGKIEYIKVNTNKTSKRKSYGRPLTMKVPIESIIPITIGGDSSNHIYYIMLLNENGTPLEISEDEYRALNNSNVVTNIGNTNTVSGDAVNSVLNKALSSMTITANKANTNELETVYSNILNEIILSKIDKGTIGNVDDINLNSSFYKVMLSRSLKAKQTKLLFLPKELVQYYAFEYDADGIGVSKLEKLQMLFSLKSILLLSRVSSTIKNSIPITKVTGTLDEIDPNPIKTMEKIKSQVIAARQNLVPLGMIDAKDISSWLHQSGIVMSLTHPLIPNMELNVSDENRNLVTPDGDLETKIDEKIYMGMSLTPEIVQAGYQTDYATTVTAKNLLMAKRISEYQEALSRQLSNNGKIYISCDMSLQDKLEGIILKSMEAIKERYNQILEDEDVEQEEKDKYTLLLKDDKIIVGYLINSIIKKFNISLPAIDMVEAPALKNAFNDYKETLDSYIELILPDSVLAAGMGEEVGGKVSVIRDIIKSTLMRKFMTDNNYIPELTDMITEDSDGKPKINVLSEFNALMKPMSEALIGYLKDEDGVRKLIQDAYKNAGIEDTGSEGDSYGDDNNNNSGGDGSNDGSEGEGESGDDFGSDDDNGSGNGFDFGGDNGETSGDGDGGFQEEDGDALNTEDEDDEESDSIDKVEETKPKEDDNFDNQVPEEKDTGDIVTDEKTDDAKADETKDSDYNKPKEKEIVKDEPDEKDSDGKSDDKDKKSEDVEEKDKKQEETNKFKKNHSLD